MNRSCCFSLGILLAGLVLKAGAQQSAPSAAPALPPLVGTLAAHPDRVAAKSRPSDVDTVDHLVTSLYEVISGAAGKPRDWDRFRSLFLPDGRLGVVRPQTPPQMMQPRARAMSFSLRRKCTCDETTPTLRRTASLSEALRTASRCSVISCTCGVPMRAGTRNAIVSHSQGASTRSRLCTPRDASGLPASSGTKSDLGWRCRRNTFSECCVVSRRTPPSEDG